MIGQTISHYKILGKLGEREEALKWLERGLKEKYCSIVYTYACPYWDFFRDDPRFQEFVKKLGIPDPGE
jgi:hypothetical protein